MELTHTVSLYYRGAGEDYSEDRSLSLILPLDQSEPDHRFIIADHTRPIVSVRLVLPGQSDSIGYVRIYGITVWQHSTIGQSEEPTLDLRTAADLQQNSTIIGLRLHSRSVGELYAVEADRPGVELSFPQPLEANGNSIRIEFAVEVISGSEHLLIQDMFLTEQERLEQELRTAEFEIETLKNRAVLLETYERSSAWRLFLCLYEYNEQFARLRNTGISRSFMNLFRLDWWSRREPTKYEKWRGKNQLENRNDPHA